MKVETKNMNLLFVGDSNWNYYLDENVKTVYSVAKKDSGASDTYFGDTGHFKRFLLDNLKRNEKLETRITANGFRLIPEYEIK